MLSYTGHPFVDVGIATITAFVEKTRPEDVTAEDLDKVATYIEREYVRPPLRGYLTMAFTSNAWFIQDAYNPDRPELTAEQRTTRLNERTKWATRHIRQWQSLAESSSDEVCVFTGLPSVATTLSGKLPQSRAGRAQMPLLQGDDAINFFTYGSSGLPISGIALLALQCFPLGCIKSGVGLLAVHADNSRLMLDMAREFWQQNERAITQAQVAGDDKMPAAPRSLRTLLIETLLKVERERRQAVEDQEAASITAYNFNNGKSPDLRVYYLPLEIMRFLNIAHGPTYYDAWSRIVGRGWQLAQQPKGKRAQLISVDAFVPKINFFFEDLFRLPDDAPRFIRTYFLRLPQHTTNIDDPRRGYTLRNELDLVSWPLVELFLMEVLHMDKDRIVHIAQLGDKLADYVQRNGGKRFFRAFVTEQNPAYFRTLLIRANTANIRAGGPSLFDMEMYIDVFEEGFEVLRPDWRLARDLVLMRMIDQLKPWLAQTPDALPEPTSEDEDAVAPAA